MDPTPPAADPARPRIPRVIHQTWKTRALPPAFARCVASWKAMNPGWEHRLYDDADCDAFVAAECPRYLAAYRALRPGVERADLFRYLVVWRRGGCYADMDTTCEAPLDALVRPDDDLLVGVERLEEANAPAAVSWGMARVPLQLCQWAFLAAPGHPALEAVANVVSAHALSGATLHADPDMHVLLKTGPGPWTDVMMLAALRGQVRVLDQRAFAATPAERDGVWVRHHYAGTWRAARQPKPEAGAGASAGAGAGSGAFPGLVAAIVVAALAVAVAVVLAWRLAAATAGAATAGGRLRVEAPRPPPLPSAR